MARSICLPSLLVLLLTLSPSGFAEDFSAETAHRAEAIRRYEGLVNNPSPALAGRRDELMFRLALLYLEEAQASGPGTEGSAAGYYRRAQTLLDQVLERKDTVFREEALYYRGISLQETGRVEESIAAFRSLLREYPSSARAAEVWFRIGNDAIQRGKVDDAFRAYEEVLRRGDPSYHDQAAYMFSWTAFSLHEESRARTTLMDLLQRLEAGGQQQANLYPEAVELLAKAIRSEGNPALLSGPWVGARPAFAQAVLRRVADLFRETSAYLQAATTYEQFLREYPDSADSDEIEKIVIDSYLKGGDPVRAQIARVRLIQRHVDGGRLRPERVGDLAPIVKDSAVYLHTQAREAKRADLFRQAIDAYELYAASVSPGPAHWEAVFLQAEALKEMGDSGGAADRYRRVAESVDPARGEEAAFRRIALLEDLRQGGGATFEPLLAAYEDYFRLYSGATREVELRTRHAGYLFDEKRFADVLVAGGGLVTRLADPAERRKTKLLLARAAFAEADYAQSASWAKQVLDEGGLDAAKRTEVEEIHVAALYKAAEAIPDRPLEASGIYELLAVTYPRHKSAPASLYNGAVLLRDNGEKARALALFRRLIELYPQTDLARDSTVAATAIYKEMGEGAAAAELLEKAATRSGSPTEKADYLFEAAGQAPGPARTIALYESFLKVAPNDLRAARARMAIAKAAGELGQGDKAERFAREAIARTPIDSTGEGAQQFQVIAAEARMLLGEAALRRYEAIRLVEPVAVNLKKKQQAMEVAIEELGKAAAFGFADISLASFYKIGYAQREFADAIMQAPRPKNLDSEQMVEYETLLREQVSPYQQAAERSFRTALEQGRLAGVENEWTARARGALGESQAPPTEDVPILPGG